MKKLKIAIFDLTDCEGCELQFLALREKLAHAGHDFEITNWRLANTKNETGPFDVTFIEGSPITDSDIETIKQARRVSQKIITLGTCAFSGGIQASLSEKDRVKNLEKIYGSKYKVKSKPPKPISYYIDVDIELPGCPINPQELEKLLTCLFMQKKFTPAAYPVCLECKTGGNPCLFLEEGFCLGPVTKGGCGAPCPKAGLRCYGCFGPIAGSNMGALEKAASHLQKEELDLALKMYFNNTKEYKEYKTRKKNG